MSKKGAERTNNGAMSKKGAERVLGMKLEVKREQKKFRNGAWSKMGVRKGA